MTERSVVVAFAYNFNHKLQVLLVVCMDFIIRQIQFFFLVKLRFETPEFGALGRFAALILQQPSFLYQLS